MKKIVKIIFLCLIIMLPVKIKGYCTTEDKIRYSNLAKNITTSYDFVEKNGNVTFNITIHNVHKDLIVMDTTSGIRYSSNVKQLNNYTINNLNDGTSYSFNIYASNPDCSYRIYNTLYLTFPKYNKYYNDPVCDGLSDYIYCQKWVDIGGMNYDQFVNLVNDYKEDEEIIINNNTENKKDLIYIIGDFWAKYYLYIAGGIILICLPIIIIKNKRDSFDF